MIVMLEAAALPILTQAVSFLFDECKQILAERRQRREAAGEVAEPQPAAPPEASLQTKTAALTEKVVEAEWLEAKLEIEQKIKLLRTYVKSYQFNQLKEAKYGADLPLHIMHEMEAQEAKIAQITQELQELLSRVYAKKVVIAE
jgi:hypothetical protein